MNNIGKRLIASARWSVAGDVFVAVSSALAAIVAARLVPKEDIGLVGIVLLALTFVETVTQSGVEQALVQRASEVNDALASAWTWQVGRGLFIALLVMGAAPVLVEFYDEPALLWLTIALAGQPLLRGASNLRILLRVRQLDFRLPFLLNVIPAAIKLAAVAGLGWYWQSAWALVVAALAEHGVRLVLSHALDWRRPRFGFDWREVLELLRFGRWVTGLSILAYLVTRADDLFISKHFGPADLAVYQIAYSVASVPATSVSHVVGRVTFPAYARLQYDPERLRSAFREVLSLTCFAAFGSAVVLVFIAPFLPLVVGEQWAGAVPILQVLAVAGAIRAFAATGGPLFQGTGRPDWDVRMNLPRLALLVGLVWPLGELWGLTGVSIASLASVLGCLPVWWLGVRAQIGLGLGSLARTLVGPVVAAGLTAAVFGALHLLVPIDYVGMVLVAVVGPLVCLAGMWALERLTGSAILPSLRRLREL